MYRSCYTSLPQTAYVYYTIPAGCLLGLHGIHSLGMVFCDLRPSKLLLDGTGTIKFSDFSLARIEGENLEELLGMFGEQSNGEEDPGYDAGGDHNSRSYNKVGLQ